MVGIAGLGASLDLLTSLGLGPKDSPLADHVLAITDYACQRLAELGATLLAPRSGPHSSGIVTFVIDGHEPNDIRRRLQAAGIVVRCRAGGVRLSPHGYATLAEVDCLIDELRLYLQTVRQEAITSELQDLAVGAGLIGRR